MLPLSGDVVTIRASRRALHIMFIPEESQRCHGLPIFPHKLALWLRFNRISMEADDLRLRMPVLDSSNGCG
jgi:hypothetical protein